MKFKFCSKCVTMTPHKDDVCQYCKSGHKVEASFADMSHRDLVQLTLETMYQSSITDAKLTILMDWLLSYSAFNVSDGIIEYALTKSQEASVHKVGEYLQEINRMDDEALFRESLSIKLKDL